MKALRAFTAIVLTLIFTLPSSAQEQQAIYVGISRESFNYFASSQHNSNWCWAASLQMIFNYYGINITQEQIVARSYGIDPTGKLPNWTANWAMITANLNNWSVDNNGRRYTVRAVFTQGAPNPTYLVDQLSQGRPILIGYQSGPGSGHAVVITACSYTPSNYGPIIQSIVVRDPWPDESNIANEGRREWTGLDLASRIQAHWFIVVQ